MSETVQTSEPKEFKGTASALRNTIWIGSEDIEKPVTLTIKAVVVFETVVWPHGRVGNNVAALQFVETNKFLHLCAESREAIKEVYGKKVVEWKGKQVNVYVKQGVRLGRDVVTGVRAKPIQQE